MTGQTPNPGRQAGVEHRWMLGLLERALGRKFRGGRRAGGHPSKKSTKDYQSAIRVFIYSRVVN
jgi:hypothetical protein